MVYQAVIRKLFPTWNNRSGVWFLFEDLKAKGFLAVEERNDLSERDIRPFEVAITHQSHAGNRQIENVKYFALTSGGKSVVGFYHKALSSIIPDEKFQLINNLKSLLYHTHKEHKFNDQKQKKDAVDMQSREKEQKKKIEIEKLIADHREALESFRLSDFEPRLSDNVKNWLLELRLERGASVTFTVVREAWKNLQYELVGIGNAGNVAATRAMEIGKC